MIANGHAEELFGWTYNELIEKTVEELLPPRFRAGHPNHREYFLNDARVRPMGAGLELFALRKDGAEIPVDISLAPVTIESHAFVVAAIRDATERHRSEELKKVRSCSSRGRGELPVGLRVLLRCSSGYRGRTSSALTSTRLGWTSRGDPWRQNSATAGRRVCILRTRRGVWTPTQSFDRREKFRMEYRLRRHDGQYRWVIDDGVPRFNHDGSFAGYVGIGIDISDLKLAERQITLANERLRLAMESGKSVAWEWDIRSGRDFWFGDLKTMFGIPSDTFVGNIEDFRRRVHPEDRERVRKAVNDAMQGREPYAAEFRLVWPDGTVRWITAKGRFYYSQQGEPERMLGMAVDITDNKKAESALRASEERFRMAAQAGKMYAFEWDTATDIIMRSGEPAEILGNDQPQYTTGQQAWTKVHPEDRERLKAAVAGLGPEAPYLNISHRLLRSDGTVNWVERSCHADFDERGKMLRIVGMVADITERKSGRSKPSQT